MEISRLENVFYLLFDVGSSGSSPVLGVSKFATGPQDGLTLASAGGRRGFAV